MSQVKIDTVQKSTDAILQKVGKQSFVDWEAFSQSSSEVARSIDELTTALSIFRQIQHKSFIQTMRKLKGLDLPDLLQAVKNKKLPKQALRGVLGRFKLEGDNLELLETKEQLKANAQKQFQTYVEKNKQFATALSSYTEFINKKAQESGLLPSQETTLEAKDLPKSTVKFNLNEQLASKIASDIKIQYLAGTQFISLDTYTHIVDGTFKLIKSQYEKLTVQARKKQRQNFQNHKQYLRLLNQYLMNGEALVNQGQTLLAKKVGVSEQKLGESEMALMDRGLGNNLLMVQSQLRAKIKQSLQSQKDVSAETAKQIIQYQVKLIDQKGNEINSILSNLEKGPQVIQMVPMLLALILNDYVFQKYGYEEEDFMVNLGEQVIATNPQFIKIFRDMEMGIMKLMQRLDVIPSEVAEMMKQQQAYLQQMGAQGIPPGLMPGMGQGQQGIMPGLNQSSNPMEMLQRQQMEQMQAMFGQMGLQPPK